MATLLNQLKDIVNQVDDIGCCPSFCPQVASPCFPFLQVCMLDPPCTTVPIEPQYVKPLQMPPIVCNENQDTEEKFLKDRTYNFYNYYNVDYHKTGEEFNCRKTKKRNLPYYATTVGGKYPNCNESHTNRMCTTNEGCPTGFKPCDMKLCSPPGCHPLGTWYATIQKCPPKRKKRVCIADN